MARDVPHDSRWPRQVVSLGELRERADVATQVEWPDLPKAPGIYLVRWSGRNSPTFLDQPTRAVHAVPVAAETLRAKWTSITSKCETDILYVGQGGSLRDRIRQLVRFGLSKSDNHVGGAWLWQVREIDVAELVLLPCPAGVQRGFENEVLERFYSDHGDYPLANRKGPPGSD